MPDDSPGRAAPHQQTTSAPKASVLGAKSTATTTPSAFIWANVTRSGGRRVWGIVAFAFVGALTDTLQPYALGALVNALSAAAGFIGEHGADAIAASPIGRQAFFWFAVLCGVWISGPVIMRLHTLFAMTTMLAMRGRIQDELFVYMHGHAPSFFLDQMSGGLTAKARNAAGAMTNVVDYLFSTMPRLIVLFAVSAVLVARQAPEFLALFGAFALVFAVVAAWLAQGCRKYAKAQSVAGTAYTGRFVDSLNNWDLVRAFARGGLEKITLDPLTQREYDTGFALRVVLFRMRMALHFVGVVFLIAVVWWAFSEALHGRVSIGTFTMLMSLTLLISAHVNALGDNLLVFFEQLGVLTDSLETITKPHDIVDVPGAKPLVIQGGTIDIRDLVFRYPDGTQVFHGLNLSIAAGEKIGLVGASGSGKSTLLRLLRRQFHVQGGAIAVDGQDITGVTWDSLHEAFSEVPQTPSVFHRSVRDNIIYGRPTATDAEMIDAAKLAHCHDFISARKGGYEAIVGEKGMKLSGGERQRVAIARAFLKNAPILILDEATSSLDSEAEHLIQDGLLKLMDGRTVIAVAHRLSTIMHLDRIIVLDKGAIVEQGTHAQLLALDGVYARLWNRQAGGFM